MLLALSRCWAPLSRRPLPLLVPARGRKSRHDPPAKSKAGWLKEPPPVEPAELLVVSERYRQYRLVLQALRMEFKQEVMRKHREERLDKESGAEAMEEHLKLMAWNSAENERLRKKREERLRREEEELQDRKLQGALNRAKLMEDFLKQKEREVLQLQEEARNFITPENLDERIEECLDNPRNYNFAIDKEGCIVKRSVPS
ncbi:28S ribosomal protein S26, mitochondrial [Trachemys scripta elegans]|uniref:28S ribosomal protein S26, mitochondrial n=1 Tax=Trachemys scripta elegans TaxID=31138 RepID=UPI001554A2FA|nr:28S ribosomal protein S26, mitochondrial [Trachemys scripta elegans]